MPHDPEFIGKRVAITGCSSGVGEAVARQLAGQGAQVFGLSRQAPKGLNLASFISTDLRNPDSVRAAAKALGPDRIDALFLCAGLPTTNPAMDIVKVNFIGHRVLADLLMDRIANPGAIVSCASTAGNGWERQAGLLKELIGLADYEAMAHWFSRRLEEGHHPYVLSKQAQVFWTLHSCATSITHGVRMNCTVPGPIASPFLDHELAKHSADLIAVNMRPINRPSSPDEQAAAMLFLAGKSASFINGALLHVDGGHTAAIASGQLDVAKAYDEVRGK